MEPHDASRRGARPAPTASASACSLSRSSTVISRIASWRAIVDRRARRRSARRARDPRRHLRQLPGLMRDPQAVGAIHSHALTPWGALRTRVGAGPAVIVDHAHPDHRSGGHGGAKALGAIAARRVARRRVDLVVAARRCRGTGVAARDHGPDADRRRRHYASPASPGSCSPVAPDVIFDLAAVVSGEAESDFEKGYRVNLDATRHLLEAIRLAGWRTTAPRLVFSSSIAVFGPPVARRHRRRPPHHAGDELWHPEGDRRAPAGRLHAARLPRRHRHPPAHDLRAAGRAEPGRVGLLLQHHPRASARPARRPARLAEVRHWFASPRAAVGFLLTPRPWTQPRWVCAGR